jgi:hypothetical protein
MPDVAAGNGRAQSELWVAHLVRRAATGVKVVGFFVGLGALLNGWLAATVNMNQFFNQGFATPGAPVWYRVQQFLNASLQGLAWGGVVVAMGYALQLAAAFLARRVEPAADDEVVDDPADLFTASPSAVLSAPVSPTPRWARTTTPTPEVVVNDDVWKP